MRRIGLLGFTIVPSHVPVPAAMTYLTRFLAGIANWGIPVCLRLMSVEMPRMAGWSKVFEDDTD